MKTLLFALLASVLLTVPATALGGGGGGEGGNAEESGGRRHRILTSSEDFVPLDPLTATVHSDFRLRGILHIEAGLDIPDNRLRRRAVSLMPRLRDRYVSALAMYAGANYSYGEVPDADRIAVILQQATDEALGQDGAEVLLGMIIIHEN
ncbi:hypothetical protein [Hyphobacterium sp.]|uniref:hypothetical protein n=1 Tax=Hyphobacterium sp. TaxID=2004662 RepID=UPI003B517183